MDRKDIGSWLQGPKAALEQQGMDFGYPGQRLGMPQTGPGSAARMGRRLSALVIDWFTSNLIVTAIFSGVAYGSVQSSVLVLGVFLGQVTVFTILIGASFGQQILGVGIRAVDGKKLGTIPTVLRTFLLGLAIPALIWDRDGRGLHDKITKSIAVRTR